MKLTVWQRLDLIARQITPTLLTLALVMVGMVPLHLPDLAPVVPWLALIAVYYWSVHRPDLMPAAAVFAVGLFHDLAAGTALGVGVLVLLLVHVAVVSQRRFFMSRSFMVIWFGFAVIALGACTLSWLLNALLAGTLVDARPAAFQFMTTVAAYPPLAWLFVQVQRSMLRT
ncbi:rod shape-determining protein MreD [Ferruginivarius sediminum]|uniref:Rod shape-determining protein MreD n=1 Tax=Ferruginivarius sediminum TaxID=2661937 RepID=A0A369TE30_9PROT|nr:rod shape-determining protein MreD [Ferruginivarius sediminum]RDD63611.1 rod shape-determining protein MreD [Ferruginivarius sediminum]